MLAAAVVLLVNLQAAANESWYYVAPAPLGSDKNDCSLPSQACRTFQHVVDLCAVGQKCNILAAPGAYSQKTNVVHHKVVFITGPKGASGICEDRSAVVVDDRNNGLAQPGTIFWSQDHATLSISCITLASYGEGSTGLETRQFAIGDADDISFEKFSGGIAVAARETSKITVANPNIFGDVARFASASDLSQVTIGGRIRLTDNLNFGVAFVSSLFGSVVSVEPSEVIGGNTISGASYQCVDLIIKRDVALPGGDIAYSDNADCRLFGLASNSPTLVDEKLEAAQARWDEKLEAAQARWDEKLLVLQAQADERLRLVQIRADQKLRRNSLIEACALLVIGGVGGALVWVQRRRLMRLENIARYPKDGVS